jgi:hypothetical protein
LKIVKVLKPTCLANLFLAGQRRQVGRAIWEKDPEQKKDHKSVAQNIQHVEQKVFGDEVVGILPGNPFEESLEENLHEVSTGIRQIRNRPIDSGESQNDREKRDTNSAEDGIADELATHVGTYPIASNHQRIRGTLYPLAQDERSAAVRSDSARKEKEKLLATSWASSDSWRPML